MKETETETKKIDFYLVKPDGSVDKMEKEASISLFDQKMFASTLRQKGNIVLFESLSSTDGKNEDIYHNYLYLPFDNLSINQENVLRVILDVFSLQGKVLLEHVNPNQRLTINRYKEKTISLSKEYYTVDDLMNDIKQVEVKVFFLSDGEKNKMAEICYLEEDRVDAYVKEQIAKHPNDNILFYKNDRSGVVNNYSAIYSPVYDKDGDIKNFVKQLVEEGYFEKYDKEQMGLIVYSSSMMSRRIVIKGSNKEIYL